MKAIIPNFIRHVMKQTDQTQHENQWPTHGSEHPTLPFVPRTDQDKYIAQKNKKQKTPSKQNTKIKDPPQTTFYTETLKVKICTEAYLWGTVSTGKKFLPFIYIYLHKVIRKQLWNVVFINRFECKVMILFRKSPNKDGLVNLLLPLQKFPFHVKTHWSKQNSEKMIRCNGLKITKESGSKSWHCTVTFLYTSKCIQQLDDSQMITAFL